MSLINIDEQRIGREIQNIGIEVKLRAGKGKVYERCAEKYNIDTLARSTIYLKVASPPLSALCPLLLGD